MNTLLSTFYLTILCISLLIGAFFLIRQLNQRKETENNLLKLKKKIDLQKADFKDYYTIGTIYLSKKLFDQAILHFAYSLKIWDRSDTIGLSNLYNAIGFTYFESGQFDMSIYYYQEATKLNPKYVVALNNLAHSYEKKRMLPKAVETYEKVLDYDKSNSTAYEKLQYLARRTKTRDDRI
jgi:tetratricopeptide (TPR) repeat protein